MKQIDDYDLIDLDYDEFIRRGLEELRWENEHQAYSSHTRDAKTPPYGLSGFGRHEGKPNSKELKHAVVETTVVQTLMGT